MRVLALGRAGGGEEPLPLEWQACSDRAREESQSSEIEIRVDSKHDLGEDGLHSQITSKDSQSLQTHHMISQIHNALTVVQNSCKFFVFQVSNLQRHQAMI